MSEACGLLVNLPPRPVKNSVSILSRWVSLSCCCLAFLLTVSLTSVASAQDDAAAEFGGEAEPAAVAEPPADGDAAPADAPAPGGESTKKTPPTLLRWIYDSLGLGYLAIFLAISITLVSLFVMNILAARRDTLCPQELVDSFEEKLNDKEFQAAYDMARTDESVLGQVLSAGLAKLSRGYNKALEGM